MKHTLLLAIEGDKRAAKKLCDEFRRIAVAYLRTKASRNNFLLQYLYNDIDDLALDCIADLFGREENCFTQLEAYLSKNEIEGLKKSEVFTKIRRLVFSKVNEGLYRNYQKFDPSLSKIIRNLKRTLEEEKVDGAFYNTGTGEIIFDDQKPYLPDMPDEILEIKLSGCLSEIQNTVDAVKQLRDILVYQEEYSLKVPLVGFAIILRKVFAYRLEMEGDNPKSPIFNEEELHVFVERSIEKQKNTLIKTYVHSGKIGKNHFNNYLLAAKDIIKADFIKDSPREGYFEHFEFYFPEVSYRRYREEYRMVLEYLVKKIREQLILEIKNEEKFSKRLNW